MNDKRKVFQFRFQFEEGEIKWKENIKRQFCLLNIQEYTLTDKLIPIEKNGYLHLFH